MMDQTIDIQYSGGGGGGGRKMCPVE